MITSVWHTYRVEGINAFSPAVGLREHLGRTAGVFATVIPLRVSAGRRESGADRS